MDHLPSATFRTFPFELASTAGRTPPVVPRSVAIAFIMSAIMCCPEGGLVTIPEGTYLHRGIYLKSGINIEIKENAKLVLISSREDIVRMVPTN